MDSSDADLEPVEDTQASRAELIRKFTLERSQSSGPLPPPEFLGGYNEILPGAADRIIKMAEAQSSHRQDLEFYALKSDSRRSDRGLYAALIVALAGFALTAYVASLGQNWLAGFVGIGTLASIVGTFVYGTESKKQERQDKFLGNPPPHASRSGRAEAVDRLSRSNSDQSPDTPTSAGDVSGEDAN